MVVRAHLHVYFQVPDCPLGFVLYARTCLGFQQHRIANVFADKGALVAERTQEELSRCVVRRKAMFRQ